ncbi:MAG TPA: DUF4302 domain-containing protein [Fulvivirga sp.]|nr:DUF4302 domain-containing protein [Fulvivirga sp.]
MKHIINILILTLLIASCKEDRTDIAPVEERTAAAIKGLKDKLTAPTDGWLLQYSPISESGIYLMILKFNDDGTVNIKSDVAANNGEFTDETIPYRIDNALGLELILETYGVFHYLFELQQAQFGAEFEFLFVEEDGSDLIFKSKTDNTDVTILRFEPATSSDESLLSIKEAGNLALFEDNTPQIFGRFPVQQVVFNEKNISLFWSLDLDRRLIMADMVATGKTPAEVISNNNFLRLNHTTGYAFQNGKLVLLSPLSFNFEGVDATISEVTLNEVTLTGDPLCSQATDNSPVYDGSITGLGTITILKSLIESSGFDFQPMNDRPYSVNVIFVFDSEGNSLFQSGIILEKFPEATGFIFNYGLESNDEPANALGFTLTDANGEQQTYLREFDATATVGNKINVVLNDNFYFSSTPGPEDEQNLRDITDTIFESGEMYIFDLPNNGATVFHLFNPCNGYEVFLVQ